MEYSKEQFDVRVVEVSRNMEAKIEEVGFEAFIVDMLARFLVRLESFAKKDEREEDKS